MKSHLFLNQVVNLSTSRYMTARYFSPFKTLSVYSDSSVRTRENDLKDILYLVLLSGSRTVSSQGVLYLYHRGMEGRELLLLRRKRQNLVTRSLQSLTIPFLVLQASHTFLYFCSSPRLPSPLQSSFFMFDVQSGDEANFLPHLCGSYQFVE